MKAKCWIRSFHQQKISLKVRSQRDLHSKLPYADDWYVGTDEANGLKPVRYSADYIFCLNSACNSFQHRMACVGRDIKSPSSLNPLPWAGIPPTKNILFSVPFNLALNASRASMASLSSLCQRIHHSLSKKIPPNV